MALVLALVACGGGGGSSAGGDAGQPVPSVLSIAVSAAASSVKQGRSLQMTAVATYSDGTTQDVKSVAAWSSVDGTLLSVSSDGLVSGVAAGATSVTASLGGISQSSSITVLPLCTFGGVTDGAVVSNAAQLRAALTAAGGNGKDDTIYINGGDYIADTPFVYDAKGTLEKISLVGCDTDDVVFDGRSLKRVFHFQKNGPITDYQSGAVDIYHPPFPSLSISKITIKNGNDVGDNNMYGRNGGGMLIERYTTEMDEVVFSGNTGQYWGGGFAGAGDLTIRSSRFTGNTALQSGSAFESCGSIVMSDTVVDGGNSSSQYAGAAVSRPICIEADYATKPVSIYRSTFKGNGSALGVIGGYGLSGEEIANLQVGEVVIEDSLFEDNTRRALDFADAGNLTVRRTRFLRNGPRKNSDELTLIWADCTNQSQNCSWGGAVAIRDGIGVHRFEDSEFTDNYSPNYGGAIFHAGGNCELASVPCVPPVAARATQPSLILVNTIFRGNRSHRGAAVSVGHGPGNQGFQYGNAMVVGGSFVDNVATAVVPTSGNTPLDGPTSSILYVGGQLTLCGQTTFSGNVADQEVLTLGGTGSSSHCSTSR